MSWNVFVRMETHVVLLTVIMYLLHNYSCLWLSQVHPSWTKTEQQHHLLWVFRTNWAACGLPGARGGQGPDCPPPTRRPWDQPHLSIWDEITAAGQEVRPAHTIVLWQYVKSTLAFYWMVNSLKYPCRFYSFICFCSHPFSLPYFPFWVFPALYWYSEFIVILSPCHNMLIIP